MASDNEFRRVEAAPPWAVGGDLLEFTQVAPESLDRVASELHLVAERLRHAAAFRNALSRASSPDDQDRIDYLHA